MRASAFALYLTTALAAPSLRHSHGHFDLDRRDALDARDVIVTSVVYSTVYEYLTVDPNAQSVPAPSAGPAPAPTIDPNAAPPSNVAPVDSTATTTDSPAPTTSVDAPSATSQDPPAPTSDGMGQTASSAVLATSALTSAMPASSASAATSVKASSSVKASAASVASVKPSASATAAPATGANGLAFKDMVIFGDNLSDRGNGSSDHNVAGNPETIYGFKTWTDGLIAAEVLANSLKVPIKYDYAYGHAAGGSKFGATVDNTFTQSDANAPSCADQIKNYTSNANYYSKDTVANSVHFLWCGNNDVLPWAMPVAQSTVKVNQSHIFFGDGANQGNQQFATTLGTLIANQVRSLIAAGAEHIFVPNVYPRHVAPVVAAYFKLDAPSVTQYGQVIQAANTELKNQLSTMKTKGGKTPVYYDAFGYLMNLYNAAKTSQANGIKYVDNPGKDICDGATGEAVPGTSNWDLCQVQNHGSEFYWMQFLDMTAHVHALLAADMQKAVQTAFKA